MIENILDTSKNHRKFEWNFIENEFNALEMHRKLIEFMESLKTDWKFIEVSLKT